jgi:hypothetical protein
MSSSTSSTFGLYNNTLTFGSVSSSTSNASSTSVFGVPNPSNAHPSLFGVSNTSNIPPTFNPVSNTTPVFGIIPSTSSFGAFSGSVPSIPLNTTPSRFGYISSSFSSSLSPTHPPAFGVDPNLSTSLFGTSSHSAFGQTPETTNIVWPDPKPFGSFKDPLPSFTTPSWSDIAREAKKKAEEEERINREKNQCQATCKTGKRCENDISNGNYKYCWKHTTGKGKK